MKLITSILLLFCVGNVTAQKINISQQTEEIFDNVKSIPVYADSLTSTFIIYIKNEVPLHKHAEHTEQIYVLEGTASMRLDDIWITITPNDFIVIPKNSLHAVKVTSAIPLKVLSIQSPYYDGSDKILITE